MQNNDVATAINRFYANECIQDDVELILRSYEPLFRFYTNILIGKQQNNGKAITSDDGVRVFLLNLKKGSNIESSLAWLRNECSNFQESELRATVIEAFFRAITLHSRVENFSKYLAENVLELIGNSDDVLFCELATPETSSIDVMNNVPCTFDTSENAYNNIMRGYTLVEKLLIERNIPLTDMETRVIKILTEEYDVKLAAKILNVSSQRIYDILNNIKKKLHAS